MILPLLACGLIIFWLVIQVLVTLECVKDTNSYEREEILDALEDSGIVFRAIVKWFR